MEKLVFATRNPGKVKEMHAILKGLDVEILSMEEAGVPDDIIEDGDTFEENARKKAEFVSSKTGEWSLGEDSGICIEALNGAPGIHSARFAGENATGDDLINLTLSKIQGVKDRHAWFETALVLIAPDKRSWVFNGRVNGTISEIPRGMQRPKLPYDVIFVPEGYTKTFAEMSDEEKNSLSHRGRAFAKLREFLKTLA